MQIRHLFAGLVILALVTVTLAAATAWSSVWTWGGIAVGTLDLATSPASLTMPDIITLPDGTYRMFYDRSPNSSQWFVSYANSTNGETWTAGGDSLSNSIDPATYSELGGSRVVRLSDGRYRMYFRASAPHPSGPPLYKVYSAISSDATTFTIESGVRINIYPDDSSSSLKLAGHGAFYALSDGTYAGIISADPVGGSGPSDLYLCRSSDGLTWTGCAVLYADMHDPVVVQREGRYHLFYSSAVPQVTYHAMSFDGINWPTSSQATALTFSNSSGGDVSQHVGDVGALVTAAGDIRIFANWGPRQEVGSPSTAIAWWKPAAAAPIISTNPGNVSVTQGQSATFTVRAVGYPTPSFQWRKGGTAISGAASDILTLSNVQLSDAGSYDVVITNASGSVTSSAATLSVTPACSYSLSATSATAPAAGGTGTITVTTTSGCAWTAASDSSWLTITAGASATGTGTVTWSAAANTTAARTGTLTIASQAVTITQGVITTATPGAPLNLAATLQGSMATLTWQAPLTGSAPTGYIVEMGSTAGGNEFSPRPTGNLQTTYALQLTSGRFYVRVRAMNNSGQGGASNEVTLAFGSAAAPPAPPNNLTASVQGSSLTLRWNGPTTGDAIGAYVVEVGTSFGASDITVVDLGSPQTTLTATGVPSRLYYARVRARNNAGRSGPSNEVAFRVGGATCTAAPSAPVLLSAVTQQLAVGLSWLPPSSGGAATGYLLLAGTQPGSANLGTIDTGSSGTAMTASAGARTYYVRVVARNSCGDSTPSNEIGFVLGTPLAVPGAPSSLRNTGSGRTVTLVWDPPATGGAPSGYTVFAGSLSGLSNLATMPIGSAATTFTVTNVPPGRYFIRVIATNATGTSTTSNELTVTVP